MFYECPYLKNVKVGLLSQGMLDSQLQTGCTLLDSSDVDGVCEVFPHDLLMLNYQFGGSRTLLAVPVDHRCEF